MSGRGGKDQRSEALLVPVLDVCAPAEQQVDQLLVAPGAGQGQGRVVVAVCLAVQVHHGPRGCLARLTGPRLLPGLELGWLTRLTGSSGVPRSLGCLGVTIADIVSRVPSIVQQTSSGLDTSGKLGTHTGPGGRRIALTLLLARLLLVRRQLGVSSIGAGKLNASCSSGGWKAEVAQVSPGGKLEPVGGGVGGNVPGNIVTGGVKNRKSIAGPESKLRLKEKLVTEVSNGLRGLRGVLGAVSEDGPGLTGSGEVRS